MEVETIDNGAQSPSSWESLYGQKVWAKWKNSFWPCLCLDPSRLGKVHHKLLERSISSVGRRYTVRYLGMSEEAAYGFISKNDIKLYQGLQDPLLDQNSKVMKRYANAMEEGLALMQLDESASYEFHEARNRARPRSSSKLGFERDDLMSFAESLLVDYDNVDNNEGIINHVLLVSNKSHCENYMILMFVVLLYCCLPFICIHMVIFLLC